MKGYVANDKDQVNPGIYLLKKTNTLRVKITLETLYKYAECNNDAGISDDVKAALIENDYLIVRKNKDYNEKYKDNENNNENNNDNEPVKMNMDMSMNMENFANYTNDEP